MIKLINYALRMVYVKKVLFLAHGFTGLYYYRRELMERLIKEGNEVYLAISESEDNKLFEEMGCRIIPTEVDRRGTNPVADLKLILSYMKTLRKLKPDAVLTYTIKANIYGSLACGLTGNKCISNVTGLGTSIANGGLLSKITMTLYKAGLRKNHHTFFQNQPNYDLFKNAGIVNENNSSIIPGSGVNLVYHCAEEYPDKNSPIRIVFVSRVMRDKGSFELFDAAKIIKEKYPDVIFDVIGPLEEDVDPDYINELDRKGIIKYHGSQNDIHPYVKQGWANILPSYHEGIANVLLEGSACARPVLATRVTGCKETYIDGETGIGFNVKDVDDLVRALEEFIEMPYETKVEMGKKGRKFVEENYDRNIVIEAYYDKIFDREEKKVPAVK